MVVFLIFNSLSLERRRRRSRRRRRRRRRRRKETARSEPWTKEFVDLSEIEVKTSLKTTTTTTAL